MKHDDRPFCKCGQPLIDWLEITDKECIRCRGAFFIKEIMEKEANWQEYRVRGGRN
jgi:hypothetical protein